MIFHQGEQVVHRNFGVGRVISIEGMNFTSDQPSMYYHVEFNKTTVWVPIGSPTSGSMRPVTPKKHLNRFRALLKSTPAKREDDFQIRKNGLELLADHGTFKALCEIVRDLYAWNRLKPLNNYEHSLLKQARGNLAGEWSVASGLSSAAALEDIEGCLAKGTQTETRGPA